MSHRAARCFVSAMIVAASAILAWRCMSPTPMPMLRLTEHIVGAQENGGPMLDHGGCDAGTRP